MSEDEKFPWAACKDSKEYIEVAVALETLAYHNKNYLDSAMCDDLERNKQVRLLLLEAMKKM